MIAALFALAAAMVIGGCAAVIQGFPYVRLESGLAMVIAGSVAASSGAILAGIGVLGLVFRRLERAIGQRPVLASSESAAAESTPRLPPVLPAAPAFIVPSIVEPPFDPERPRIEPDLRLLEDVPPAPAEASKVIEPHRPPAIEADFPLRSVPSAVPPAPPAEPLHRPEPAPEPVSERSAEDDLFAAPEASAKLEAASEPPALRPSLDAAPEPEPEPETKPETRTVVGRYASGGNTYVMYEDGSIEAETPQGRFTFASLDELKAFVDGGGESGARGAA